MHNKQEITAQVRALKHTIFRGAAQHFEALALEVFRFQATHTPVYAAWVEALGVQPARVTRLVDIPFLPIRFFKNHFVSVYPPSVSPKLQFESSGTTGSIPSRHALYDEDWYVENAVQTFEVQYGSLKDWQVLALLPSYLERKNASLVFMAEAFVERAGSASGFFLDDLAGLCEVIRQHPEENILLLGVSFALLDLAENYDFPKHNFLTVMETGGMKGRRKELTRKALHAILQTGLKVDNVHSEYGMTELFSQAYSSNGRGLFTPAATLRALFRNMYDPMEVRETGTGALNLIDLANIETCSFIATDDLGRGYENFQFEVLGRIDASDVRGCNLMVL